MRRLALMAALALSGCASDTPGGDRYYAQNDAQLAVANAAIMTCSCIFSMEMPEAYCSAWVKASPSVARVGIDYEKKSVESSAFITWAARAHWVDEKRGCVLE